MNSKHAPDEYLAMSWHFSIEPSEWEGESGYWAWVSELPNCSTFAPTPADALSTVAQLLPAYLKAALDAKAKIPSPEGRDPEADEAGGTIVLRVPKSLHIGLKNAAKMEKTSLNQFALYALTKVVSQTTKPPTSKQVSRSAKTGKMMSKTKATKAERARA